MNNMRSDWKGILCLLTLFTFFNCAWVIRTREEIIRPPPNFNPLPESLVVLPDSSGDKHNYPIVFDIGLRQSQPILTYAVRADGKFEASYVGHFGHQHINLGYLNRSEIQHLIDTLNNLGFFQISGDRSLYCHFDVEKIYLFGLLIRTKRYVIEHFPRDVVYESAFRLKNFTHGMSYYGVEGITEKHKHIKELQVLKHGSELIESYFEKKALEFSDSSYYISGLFEHQIVPFYNLDEKIEPIRTANVTLSPHEYTDKDEDYTVVIKMLVAPDGQVIFGLIVKSSGYRYFDYKVLNMIKKDRFTSPKYQGNPVYTWVARPIRAVVLVRHP
jgi:TonB family protein